MQTIKQRIAYRLRSLAARLDPWPAPPPAPLYSADAGTFTGSSGSFTITQGQR